MKIRITLALLAALTLSACVPKAPPPVDKDTIITSEVNGVTLNHRAGVQAPKEFKPINEEYRSLYSASVMDRPGYGGDIITYLDNAAPFYALGEVEGGWLAISAIRDGNLIGYVKGNAGVLKDKHRATVLKDRRVRRTSKPATTAPAPKKKNCVDAGDGTACKDTGTSTWIL
ncbi:hypothetical protein [Enterobacillus tribolii]|uniref:SH3 domain-containing protein n=1 Tax=Enterobacillus tribolii TaxID=1487935 RepID=A0A370Q700_9GAMM|nr:hypothetical protein [Enterobacillus tribolii]MBW7984905.1 hypothetical protein [Enterobacillus tribolii]RDK84117.1 hypothetical protein C8D90_11436 [Enterobacillus tribolii]